MTRNAGKRQKFPQNANCYSFETVQAERNLLKYIYMFIRRAPLGQEKRGDEGETDTFRKAFRRGLTALLLLAAFLLPLGDVGHALIQSRPEDSVSTYHEDSPQDLRGSHLYAQSAILIDADTGRTLFSKHSTERLYPASMTKLMTALLVAESDLQQDQTLVASKTAANVGESKLYCEEGEEITVRDALYGMLLTSSNSYATMLAEAVAGSVEDFGVLMTNRAKELGCTDTNFVTPHGLTNENHYTTAADMAKIVRAAVREPLVAEVISTAKYTLQPNNFHDKERTYSNSNKMLPDSGDAFAYEYMKGGKTGYTDAAKHTFAGYAEKDGMRLISVVMGTTSDGKWLDTTKLMDYGFAAYQRVSLAELYAVSPKTANVQGAAGGDDGVLQLSLPAELDPTDAYLVVSKAEKEDIQTNFSSYCTVELSGNLVAPIQQGQQVGVLRFQYGEMAEPVSFPLVAARTVATELVSITPPPSEQSGSVSGGGLFVSTSAGEGGFSPLILLVAIPAALFLVLMVWLFVEIGKLKKERRARKLRQREEAIRKRYEQTRRGRASYDSTVRTERTRDGREYRREYERQYGRYTESRFSQDVSGPTRRDTGRPRSAPPARPYPDRR